MNDQGEKIVFLARELLNAGVPESGYGKKATHVAMSFKTLCFTTLLAAAGGGLVTATLHENHRPLNRYEKTEIQALIFYASKIKNIDQDALRHQVAQKVGLDSLDEMTASDFAVARRFLQETAQ